MVHFIIELERVLVVVHQVQGVQGPLHIPVLQASDRVADMAQIALGGLVGEQDLIVPVQADKIVLAFAE